MKTNEIIRKVNEILLSLKPDMQVEEYNNSEIDISVLDSIELMQMVIDIEDTFNIEISENFFDEEILKDYRKIINIISETINMGEKCE